ncbi:hypothetical protein G6L37_01005 [Agrobacterium rubi]|nr:hypothetical protein [Agrobacterium rubi]NTF23970.1 hypothetical protein [Agrobacterium rubi]
MEEARTIKRKTRETNAMHVVDVDAISVGGGLHAFRSESRFERVMQTGELHTTKGEVKQGLVDDENLGRLQNDEPYESFVPYERDDGHRIVPIMVAKEVLDVARTEGNPISYRNVYDRLVREGKLLMPNKTALVDAAASGMDVENVLFLSTDDYGLVDVRGRPIPLAMTFDYMEGGFDEENYDLQALAQHLSANPEIEIITESRGNGPVSRIPYYNLREGCEEQIRFIWRPTDASWEAFLSRCGFDEDNPQHIWMRVATIVNKMDLFETERFRLDSDNGVRP